MPPGAQGSSWVQSPGGEGTSGQKPSLWFLWEGTDRAGRPAQQEPVCSISGALTTDAAPGSLGPGVPRALCSDPDRVPRTAGVGVRLMGDSRRGAAASSRGLETGAGGMLTGCVTVPLQTPKRHARRLLAHGCDVCCMRGLMNNVLRELCGILCVSTKAHTSP